MKRNDIAGLTGLRGVAAMLIVVHHLGLLVMPLRDTVLGPALEKCGLLGMSVFFVLSGFVIQYNYGNKVASGSRDIVDFIVARFARLYPLYFVFVVGNFAYTHHVLPSYTQFLPYNLLGIQSWLYRVQDGVNVTLSQEYGNNAWSISTELMLYLLFIPLALLVRFRSASLVRGLALLLIGVLGRVLLVHFAGSIGANMANVFGQTSIMPADQWLIYFSPYGRFFEFLAGVGLAEMWMAGPLAATVRRIMTVLGCAGVAYIAASFLDLTAFTAPHWFEGDHLHIGYAIAVPLATLAICLNGKVLCGNMAIWIGEISYSLYLIHGVMIPFFSGPDVAAGYALKGIMFISILIILATITHAYVEMPAKRFIIAKWRQRQVIAAEVA
ncbi:O-acetyltransferase OatA [Paraburkholderia kirstenboschensis]|uniref:acyltransferase family protein n=1 Tax=Paraburkholderia kirstenboschensis TaxID=1245436 RepID=UPI0013E3546B|nr:acyltransferase [Paraburkholderia kirstenboschensis]CAD6548575.1 O-acetyltransferase OatA [Paraburkholderia kirstenboschensis]